MYWLTHMTSTFENRVMGEDLQFSDHLGEVVENHLALLSLHCRLPFTPWLPAFHTLLAHSSPEASCNAEESLNTPHLAGLQIWFPKITGGLVTLIHLCPLTAHGGQRCGSPAIIKTFLLFLVHWVWLVDKAESSSQKCKCEAHTARLLVANDE